jgi:hypothetical protein
VGSAKQGLPLARWRPSGFGTSLRIFDLYVDILHTQVVTFLHPDHAAPYASRAAWEQMQSDVVSGLERLAP